MKKITILISTIVLTLTIGCKKEGPVGPAGPQGPAGPAGSSIVAVDTFTVQSASWVQVSTNYYKYVHTNSSITQEIVDIGSIQVFSKSASYPDWYGWPDVVAGPGQSGYRFHYNLNTVTLLGDYFPSGKPPTQTIKVVILK